MASYSLNVGIVQRSKGQSATAAAAYNARERIEDRRTGQVYDFTKAHPEKLLFSGIYAPKDAPEWTKNRTELWNRVEEAEKRKDARLSRRLTIALPHELTPEQQRQALQDFVKENFTRRGLIADVNIHAPHHGDPRNYHAHLQVTMRKLEGQAFSANKDRDQDRQERLEEWRESWAKIGNRHLERHGHAPTLDHRTLKAQGIDRDPTIHLGKDAAAMERRGEPTDRGDMNRSIEAANRLKLEVHEIFIAQAPQKAQERREGGEDRETSPRQVEAPRNASVEAEGPKDQRPAPRMFERVIAVASELTQRVIDRAAVLFERSTRRNADNGELVQQPQKQPQKQPEIRVKIPVEITTDNIRARMQQERQERQPEAQRSQVQPTRQPERQRRPTFEELKAMLERDQAGRDHGGPER